MLLAGSLANCGRRRNRESYLASSLRTQGPITAGFHGCGRCRPSCPNERPGWAIPIATTKAGGYGSLRSQGRRVS